MNELRDRFAAVWPWLRVLAIATWIAVQLIDGFPVPRATAENMAKERNQIEVRRWVGVLDAVGIETTPEELTQEVVDRSAALARTRSRIYMPLWPFFRIVQSRQEWSLFSTADHEPFRMYVETWTREGGWQVLYRPNDDQADWHEDVLEYRRLRGIWNPSNRSTTPHHSHFVTWVSEQVFDELPEVQAVRVRFEKFYVDLPGEHTEYPSRWMYGEQRNRSSQRR